MVLLDVEYSLRNIVALNNVYISVISLILLLLLFR